MLRGNIHWVEPGPGAPGEASFRRPGVVVSHNGANASASRGGRGMVTVLPVTTNIAVLHRFQVLLSASECGLHENSKAQIEQIRSISAARIGPRIGTVPPHVMRQIDDALRIHLAL